MKEQSVLRSQVSQTTKEAKMFQKKSMNGLSGKFFPIFHYLTQHVEVHSIFYYLFFLFFMVTTMAQAMWYTNFTMWDDVTYLSSILGFMFPTTTTGQMTAFIVLSAVCGLSIVAFVLNLFWYHTKHTFPAFTAYICRLFIECVAFGGINYLGNFTFYNFYLYISTSSSTNLLYFLVSLVYLLVFLLQIYFFSFFSTNSPFLQTSLFSTWSSHSLLNFVALYQVTIFLAFLFEMYDAWAAYIAIVLHIGVLSYGFFEAINLAFAKKSFAVMLGGLCITAALEDLMLIASSFVDMIFPYAVYGAIPVGLIGGCIGTHYLIKHKFESVKAILASDSALNSDQLYYENNIHRSESKAVQFFSVGLETHVQRFLDWSLVRFCIEHYHTKSIFIFMCRIVALFPGEHRLLRQLYSALAGRYDLGAFDFFFLMQVDKIKILRQSSFTVDQSDSTNEAMILSNKINEMSRSFWLGHNASTVVFRTLSKNVDAANALWNEIIKDSPNNITLRDQYNHFLIDSATDFKGAIQTSWTIDKIENNRQSVSDTAFRSLIAAFPSYLKQDIVTYKGEIRRTKRKGPGGSSSQNSSMNGSTNATELLVEEEEMIGKRLFAGARLRLALQSATEGRKSAKVANFTMAVYFVVLMILVLSFVGYFSFTSIIESYKIHQDRVFYTGQGLFYSSVADFTSLLALASKLGYTLVVVSCSNPDRFTDVTLSFYQQMRALTSYSQYNIGQAVNTLSDLANSGVDVSSEASKFIAATSPMTYCDGTTPLPDTSLTLVNNFIYMANTRTRLSFIETDWRSRQDYCSMVCSFNHLFSEVQQQLGSFAIGSAGQLSDDHDVVNFAQYIVYPTVFIVQLLLLAGTLLSFEFEIHKFMKLMKSVEPASRARAAESIMLNKEDHQQAAYPPAENHSKIGAMTVFRFLFMIFFAAVVLLILFGNFRTYKDALTQIEINIFWTYSTSRRAAAAAHAIVVAMYGVLYNTPSTYTNNTIMAKYLNDTLTIMDDAHDLVLGGAYGYPSLEGAVPGIDNIQLNPRCTSAATDSSAHSYYECASLNQVLMIYGNYLRNVFLSMSTITDFTSGSIAHAAHIANAHLFTPLHNVDILLHDYTTEYISTVGTNLALFLALSIVAAIAILVVLLYSARSLNAEFNGALILLRRLPPLDIVANPKLFAFLLNNEKEQSKDAMSISKSFIHNNLDSILCLSKTGIIEFVNPAVSNLLGYTPDQLLGQSFPEFVAAADKDKIEQQIVLYRNNQSSSVYDDHIQCLSDDEKEIPCAVSLFGIKNETSDAIDSVVAVLRDETELFRQQQQAETAKKQSEDLLYQILPRDIVVRLNQGEKDISFQVNSASIIFIDIVKFSDFSSTLTPEQIMGTLSSLFGAFDALLPKYPLITKIKLIGDVYMAAAGLFNPDIAPEEHATQLISFALECLQNLEEYNQQMNLNLSVRIGVNSGGPVITGVLGTDKPVFDIIGDPINVSSRLQSTCVPGNIQIAQATYDLISSNSDFFIEPRGDVYLKGKGATKTYLVKPKGFFHIASSIDSLMSSS